MKLKSVTIGGFKNIRTTKINLSNITAIISPNNYGKSNLLEAIDFGVEFISASEKDRKNMMGWIKGIPIIKTLENDEFIFEIEFMNDTSDEYRYVKYGYKFSWYRDDGTGQRITDEWIDARPSESVKYSSFLKRREGKYRKEKGTTSFRSIKVDNEQLAIDVLLANEEISIYSLVKSIKSIDFHVCSSLDLRDRFQPDPIEYIDSSDDEAIAFDDRDVPRALYKLQHTDSEKYDLFLEAVYTLFPEFTNVVVQSYSLNIDKGQINALYVTSSSAETKSEDTDDIPFRIKDELYSIIITDKHLNQPININRMSTGTKRIFWLLANVFIASSKKISFIGIEELETSIHPRLLKSLLEFLNEVLEDTSVIISSHSPFLVQYLKIDNIFVGKPTIDGAAEFKKIKSSKSKQLINMARNNNMAVGEYLFELLSGDKDYETVLSFYLED